MLDILRESEIPTSSKFFNFNICLKIIIKSVSCKVDSYRDFNLTHLSKTRHLRNSSPKCAVKYFLTASCFFKELIVKNCCSILSILSTLNIILRNVWKISSERAIFLAVDVILIIINVYFYLFIINFFYILTLVKL